MTIRKLAGGALSRFRDNQRGTVAIITAVSLIPMIVAVGVGIDVSRSVSGKANLQDALDATALALANLPPGTSQATLDAKAKVWMTANLLNKDIQGMTVTVTPTKGQIHISADGIIPTTLTAMLGVDTVPVLAETTVKWGSKLEVALVLDNTGSMAGAKLNALISSSKALVTTLLAANTVTPDAVKISIVPFANTVNVGSSYEGASWLDGTASGYRGIASVDLFYPNTGPGWVDRFDLFKSLNKPWSGCVESRPEWVAGVKKDYDITDVGFSDSNPGSKIVPYFAPDGSDSGVNNAYANDYIEDKPVANSDNSLTRLKNVTKYASPTKSRSGNPNSGCGTQPLQPLTTDSSTLTTLLDKMVASGNTNVPFGLFWGWMTLSPSTPFTGSAYKQPVPYGTEDVTKVVIVLTDGENTINDGYTYGGLGYTWQSLITPNSGGATSSATATAINDRERSICANMKAKNIVIYAVPMEVNNATAKSLLKGCVTSSDNYVEVADATQLAKAFQGIAESISKLRLAK